MLVWSLSGRRKRGGKKWVIGGVLLWYIKYGYVLSLHELLAFIQEKIMTDQCQGDSAFLFRFLAFFPDSSRLFITCGMVLLDLAGRISNVSAKMAWYCSKIHNSNIEQSSLKNTRQNIKSNRLSTRFVDSARFFLLHGSERHLFRSIRCLNSG